MTARPLGKIQRRVQEILLEGAAYLDGGRRSHEPEHFQRLVIPAYKAYEATLKSNKQRTIAQRMFDRVRRRLLVYAEDYPPGSTPLPEPAGPAAPPAPSRGMELVPIELDEPARRARAVHNLGRALQNRVRSVRPFTPDDIDSLRRLEPRLGGGQT